MSNSSQSPSSENLRASVSGENRGNTIRTYIVSVPAGTRSPKIKRGHMRELKPQQTIQDISKEIEEVESIVQNIQVINVECSKCVGSFKNLFNNCKMKTKVSAV